MGQRRKRQKQGNALPESQGAQKASSTLLLDTRAAESLCPIMSPPSVLAPGVVAVVLAVHVRPTAAPTVEDLSASVSTVRAVISRMAAALVRVVVVAQDGSISHLQAARLSR